MKYTFKLEKDGEVIFTEIVSADYAVGLLLAIVNQEPVEEPKVRKTSLLDDNNLIPNGKKGRVCSVCGRVGHRKDTCPQGPRAKEVEGDRVNDLLDELSEE